MISKRASAKKRKNGKGSAHYKKNDQTIILNESRGYDMKKILLLITVLIVTCLSSQAQQSEGNPFARLGYKADVFTFGETKEFHDLDVVVEIGEVLFNTETNEVVGFIEDNDSLIELKPELQSMSIDPHCEKYYSISPYAYCMNNPVRFVDPDGKSTRVKRLDNGTYEVIDGTLDDDYNIYVYNKDQEGNYTIQGESIGVSTSITSFYDSYANNGKGGWAVGSIIDPNNNNGNIFLERLKDDDPSLISYMLNATKGGIYDFKQQDLSEGIVYKDDKWYRGMPLSNADFVIFDMDPIYTSAKDIGNMAAGYVAAKKGLSWKQARKGFDGLQKIQDKNLKSIEKASSRNAQYYGFIMGKRKIMINSLKK